MLAGTIDLVGSTFSINDSPPLVPGQLFDVDLSIDNLGDEASGGFDVTYVLSTDANFEIGGGGGDIELEFDFFSTIPGGDNSGVVTSFTLELPESTDTFWQGPREYFVGVVIDTGLGGFGEVTETDETNNQGVGDGIDFEAIFIDAPGSSGPDVDLLGTAFSVTPNTALPGDIVEVEYTVGNAGTDMSDGFDVGVYLSPDADVNLADRFLTFETISGGLNGASNTGSRTLQVALPPASDPIFAGGNGTFFLGIVVDDQNEVSETDESNNNSRGDGLDFAPINIGPQTDPPTVERINATSRFVENRANATMFARAARVSDPDTTDFGGAVLTVDTGRGLAEDVVGLIDGGGVSSGTATFGAGTGVVTINKSGLGAVPVADAVYSGDRYVITFRDGATANDVARVLRRSAYRNTSESPTGGGPAITIDLTDPDGNSAPQQVNNMVVVSIADNPTFTTSLANPSYNEGDGPTDLTGAITVTDLDTTDFGGGRLDVVIRTPRDVGDTFTFAAPINAAPMAGDGVTVSGTADGSIVSIDGVAKAVLRRGPAMSRLFLNFMPGTTAAEVAQLSALTRFESSAANVRGPKTIRFTLVDADGGRGVSQFNFDVITAPPTPPASNSAAAPDSTPSSIAALAVVAGAVTPESPADSEDDAPDSVVLDAAIEDAELLAEL